jgi:hypothetical protein
MTSTRCRGTTTTSTVCVFWRESTGSELELDLDYILEWITPAADSVSFRYRVAPARLRFRDVTNLAITIDYASASAAMGPFSIDGIERRVEQRQYNPAVCWRFPRLRSREIQARREHRQSGRRVAAVGPGMTSQQSEINSSSAPRTSISLRYARQKIALQPIAQSPNTLSNPAICNFLHQICNAAICVHKTAVGS